MKIRKTKFPSTQPEYGLLENAFKYTDKTEKVVGQITYTKSSKYIKLVEIAVYIEHIGAARARL
jgi:hypothetical protein